MNLLLLFKSNWNNRFTSTIQYLKINNELHIQSQSSFIDAVGYLHEVGKVENNTPNIADFVKVIGTFYGNNTQS